MAAYVPRKGDFVAVTFDPQSGHEQRGRRPALVVSNDLFNKHTGLCIACPITNTRRDYPFHVSIPGRSGRDGRRDGRAGQVDRLPLPQREAHRERAGAGAAGSAVDTRRVHLLSFAER